LLEDVDSLGPVDEAFRHLFVQLLYFLQMYLQVPGTKTSTKIETEMLPLSMAWTMEAAVLVVLAVMSEATEVSVTATGKGIEKGIETAIGTGIGSVTGKAIETVETGIEKGKGSGREAGKGRLAPSWRIELLLGNGGVRLG